MLSCSNFGSTHGTRGGNHRAAWVARTPPRPSHAIGPIHHPWLDWCGDPLARPAKRQP